MFPLSLGSEFDFVWQDHRLGEHLLVLFSVVRTACAPSLAAPYTAQAEQPRAEIEQGPALVSGIDIFRVIKGISSFSHRHSSLSQKAFSKQQHCTHGSKD